MTVILIPAYQPDIAMLALIDELKQSDLEILIVDDGSGSEYKHIFDSAEKCAHVISYPENRGKGAAIKTGLSCIKSIFPDCRYVITADADGQHAVHDILRVRDALEKGSEFVLTVRYLHGNAPLRSRIGNALSRWVYTLLMGHYFYDNQSGLRGFSVSNIDWMQKVSGDKYDYELNVLCYADKQRITITTIPIATIYINNNSSSHFDPIKDTIRIYKQLFGSTWVTFLCFFLIEISVVAISFVLGYDYMSVTIPSVAMGAILMNIMLNRFVAFRSVKYSDGVRVLLYSVIRFSIIHMICMLAKYQFPGIPLFVSFNVTALLMLPLEYLIHKAFHAVRYREINIEGEGLS